MSRIELFDHVSGKVKFSHKCDNNSVAKTLLRAVSNGVDLSDVSLCGADLRGVDLCNVDLRGADLRDAYLCSANLSYAYLRGANLRGALLCYTNLRGADLRGADLRGADLRGAFLCNANLCSADLCTAYLRGALLCYTNLGGADLRGADLRGADLHDANLSGADLHDANLSGADLRDADLRMVQGLYNACPVEGSFIGWKKASGFIVKLLIPVDALRSSAASTKCRCNKAFVVDIQTVDGGAANVRSVESDYDPMFKYVLNSLVEVKDFDTNWWNECAPGIHFFVDRREAVEY